VFCFCITVTLLHAAFTQPLLGASQVQGIVFHDQNANGRHDAGESGIAGVRVSNGEQVVQTDPEGRYTLPVDGDTIIFVCKPRGWQPRTDSLNRPQFFYIHKPDGSPNDDLQYKGSEPTGPLPESVNFPFHKKKPADEFRVALVADPQTKNKQQVDWYARDIMTDIVRQDVTFGITLGDLVHDDLGLLKEVSAAQALADVPWYNLVGNHDINKAAASERHAQATFERIFGPKDYAFQYGKVHFLVFDNVYYHGKEKGGYHGALQTRQLRFASNYLKTVPRSHHIVVCTHIPLFSLFHGQKDRTPQREKLLQMLSRFPRTSSFAGHQHQNQFYFLGKEHGYQPDNGHAHTHHILGAASGDIWNAAKNRYGLPRAVNHDGAPNGYVILAFDDNRYTERWVVPRRPKTYQMRIDVAEVIDRDRLAEAKVRVNVFNGSDRSSVKVKVHQHNGWQEAKRQPKSHQWRAALPEDLPKGRHLLKVRTRDMFGRIYRSQTTFRVE
jgi:hypothetical protein